MPSIYRQQEIVSPAILLTNLSSQPTIALMNTRPVSPVVTITMSMPMEIL
jgi:hypothetical protein